MKVGAEAAVCESNYVSVFDVNDGTETELGRWCGAQGEELWLLSAGSSLLVRLHTDRVIDGDYFDANYVSTNCQFDVSEPNTQIISPPEGVVLNDQLRCLWRLQVPSNSEAHFHFREFNVQGSDHNCETNGLQLFSGTSGQLTHVDTFCGSETPSNATYKQKQLTLFLDTDEFNTDKTFQLAFSATTIRPTIYYKTRGCRRRTLDESEKMDSSHGHYNSWIRLSEPHVVKRLNGCFILIGKHQQCGSHRTSESFEPVAV
ncbi:cubilin [Clonorchis sinensis]|uniref:Cubilin n=1 Tax=Clonorchis sinensis TaxID=79923 RepID=G7YYT6_CLOSI|nr:cubilin [Clonorchis sinensis]